MRSYSNLTSPSGIVQRARRIGRALVLCGMATLACGRGNFLAADGLESVEDLRINQLQFIGTHNSYHVRAPSKSGREVREWNYSHAPLDVQLDRGVRSFELDLHDRDGVFEVFHVPILDEGTTCRKL
ncbi:MAG TPA: Ca2+-dependent phosphoinositide-specific phospholipase C, partial [Pirellulales bacterium]|nr:Ca2+-dependent phosphoinositide-specific phospholipase C [Pirellulales bacterium]